MIIKSAVSCCKYSLIRVFSGLDDLYSNTSLFPPSSTQALFRSPGTVFMTQVIIINIIEQDFLLSTFLEGFLYGKIVLFLPCTLVKEVQLSPGLGIYSGILVMYFRCQSESKKSTGGTTTIIFYAVCLLYFLSTVNFILDLTVLEREVSNNSIYSKNIIFYHLCSGISVY